MCDKIQLFPICGEGFFKFITVSGDTILLKSDVCDDHTIITIGTCGKYKIVLGGYYYKDCNEICRSDMIDDVSYIPYCDEMMVGNEKYFKVSGFRVFIHEFKCEGDSFQIPSNRECGYPLGVNIIELKTINCETKFRQCGNTCREENSCREEKSCSDSDSSDNECHRENKCNRCGIDCGGRCNISPACNRCGLNCGGKCNISPACNISSRCNPFSNCNKCNRCGKNCGGKCNFPEQYNDGINSNTKNIFPERCVRCGINCGGKCGLFPKCTRCNTNCGGKCNSFAKCRRCGINCNGKCNFPIRCIRCGLNCGNRCNTFVKCNRCGLNCGGRCNTFVKCNMCGLNCGGKCNITEKCNRCNTNCGGQCILCNDFKCERLFIVTDYKSNNVIGNYCAKTHKLAAIAASENIRDNIILVVVEITRGCDATPYFYDTTPLC